MREREVEINRGKVKSVREGISQHGCSFCGLTASGPC